MFFLQGSGYLQRSRRWLPDLSEIRHAIEAVMGGTYIEATSFTR